jgi:hypothetical protein
MTSEAIDGVEVVATAAASAAATCFGVLKTGKPFDPAIAMGC